MPNDAHGTRQCTVVDGNGERRELTLAFAPEARSVDTAIVSDRIALRTIMSRDLVCVRSDLAATAIVALMIEHHVGCIPVVDAQRRPIGVITKSDFLEQLVVPTELAQKTADDIMMPFALTLDEHATIAHAAAMMMSEDTHHVLAIDEHGALVGVVSAKDVVNWVVRTDVLAVRRDASCGPPVWQPLQG